MTLLSFKFRELQGGTIEVVLTRDLKTMGFKCSAEQMRQGMKSYSAGALVQNAFSFLSVAEREFLMTGMTQEEWDAMAKETETEERDGIEASDLGWRPGQWPERFEHDGLSFRRKGLIVSSSGEVMGIAYTNRLGDVLNVFND